MNKDILQALPELVKAEVISGETADRIRAYYRQGEDRRATLLPVAWAILGGLLVGLGLVLILAHNWDEFPRATKTALAFIPLVFGQVLAGFSLWRRSGQQAWRESTATFLMLSVGASLSLVSQIYHIPGDLSPFLLSWMLLSLPLVYLLSSSMVSLLYLLGITFYAVDSRDLFDAASNPNFYWLLLLAVLPHYYHLYRRRPGGNFAVFHHWFLAFSVAVALATAGDNTWDFLFLAYFSLFSCYRLLGHTGKYKFLKTRQNGFLLAGALGLVGLLLFFSFDFFWLELAKSRWGFPGVLTRPEFISAFLTTAVALGLLASRYLRQEPAAADPLEYVFLFFILAFALSFFSITVAVVLVNLLVLLLGIYTIRQGALSGRLAVLNYGLLLIAALITCRFFDTDLSFVVRGVLFVAVGLGFFLANYWMIRKRKNHAQ